MHSMDLGSSDGRVRYAGKTHDMPSGRRIVGVSHSWATAVDKALESTLDSYPDLRHVAIQVPKAERDVTRLFHSADGVAWRQIHLPDFGGRKFNIWSIVRGAKELDGDKSFSSELSADNLILREIAGNIVEHRKPGRNKGESFVSLADWVEKSARRILDQAGNLYVSGAGSEEARRGREQSLVTIERLIRHLRSSLRVDEPFVFPESARFDAQIAGALKDFIVRRHVPFLTVERDILQSFDVISGEKKKALAKGMWADAARMPRNARFDAIYGALLRQAEGHPIFGDQDYKKLEALLAEDLAAGYRVARVEEKVFIRSGDRWRAASLDPGSEADWQNGEIISRNFGRLIIPPHRREGERIPGYTRNGPGEGPSQPRERPVILRCIDRPISGSNLHWLHAYHAWDLAN